MLLAWANRLMRPRSEETPPPLADLHLPPKQERDRFLEEARRTLTHHERIINTLRTKANVIAGVRPDDADR